MSHKQYRNQKQPLEYHRKAPLLKEPFIVGYMSVDEFREYHSNLTQLKFLNHIPYETLSMDLNYNLDKSIKRTTDDNNEKIDLLLKFLLDQKRLVHFIDKYFTFITYRRTLISVMCNVFESAEPVSIIATLYKNCIYLCNLETEENAKKRLQRSREELKFCSWGYKFEQYLLSDLPGQPPDVEKPVKENEEFSIYYYSELGNHKLFYGAQIDGLIATDSTTPPPQTDDVNTNINYLRNNCYVELKTNRVIQNRRQEINFKKHKLLRCWCQCYLAGLKGLLVGFRNDNGIIKKLQWYDTQELVEYCKNEWSPEHTITHLDMFLTFAEKAFQNEIKQNGADKPISLHFLLANNKITLSKTYSDKDVILPDWFINNFV